MDFSFNDEQRLWRDTLERFMEQEVGREYTRAHDADRDPASERDLVAAAGRGRSWLPARASDRRV